MKRFAKALKTFFKKKPAGFTTVELVIVLAIGATLIAIATPATISWMRQRGVRDAADQLALDLQRAKLLAIQRNSNCSININTPSANQYTLSITNEVIDLGSYPGNVGFTDSPDVSAPVITFSPQGICTVFGEFYLTDQNRRYRVRATAAGAVTVHIDSGGQWL